MLAYATEPTHGQNFNADKDHFDADRVAEHAATGDPGALGDLYDHFNPKLLRWFMGKIRHHQTAEDLSHETWEKIANAIPRFRLRPQGEGGFASWLYAIARNVLTDRSRFDDRRPTTLRGDLLELDGTDARDTPEEALARGGRIRDLVDAVNSLPAAQAKVIDLRYLCGFSVGETADALGKTHGAIRKAQHDGLRTLRGVAEASGLSWAIA